MHDAAYRFVADTVRARPIPPGLTVEIGGRNINGTIRSLFPPPFISLDVRSGRGVDVVADGATWMPPTLAVCVVCCEVLEHTPDAAAICAQAFRMLGAGGLFIVTTAGPTRAPHSALDGGALLAGEFYCGVDPAALDVWLTPFRDRLIVEGRAHGDVYALAWK